MDNLHAKLAISVRQARAHDPRTGPAVDAVLKLLDHAAEGGSVTVQQWQLAAAAAEQVVESASEWAPAAVAAEAAATSAAWAESGARVEAELEALAAAGVAARAAAAHVDHWARH